MPNGNVDRSLPEDPRIGSGKAWVVPADFEPAQRRYEIRPARIISRSMPGPRSKAVAKATGVAAVVNMAARMKGGPEGGPEGLRPHTGDWC
jgi:hypothetical protein